MPCICTPRDSLCVQCMDGKLQLFEQDAHAFSRVLSNTLLPGPLVYSKSLDALVSVNSSRQAICCKYQALAAAQDEDNRWSEFVVWLWFVIRHVANTDPPCAARTFCNVYISAAGSSSKSGVPLWSGKPILVNMHWTPFIAIM